MNIVRPNHFDRRNGAWSAPAWVYPSGTAVRYYTQGAWGTVEGVFLQSHRQAKRELVELLRSYNVAKVANGGIPFAEACITWKYSNIHTPNAYKSRTTFAGRIQYGNYPTLDAETVATELERWLAYSEENMEFFQNAIWWALVGMKYQQSQFGVSLYVYQPSEYYPTEFVAFNLRGDYGAPNTYNRHYYVDEDDTGDGDTAANWYNINSRPLVVVENLTTGERAVLRSIDDHGPTHNAGAPCPLYGTFYLQRGYDYRITRYRAVYAETLERAPWEESTETMKFYRFDPLPPTTQTVVASEIATETYFDLEI